MIIFWIFFIIILIRSLYSNAALVVALVWLKKNNYNLILPKNETKREFVIIIPVLREQKILNETLNHFLSINYDLKKIKIFLVSTEKEIKENIDKKLIAQTTIDIIKKLKQEINQKFEQEIIVHLHYPFIDGKMVHQLNYAFSNILRLYNNRLKNIFVAIYNADSKPNLNTFDTVNYLAKNNNLRVFQQSSLFFDNFSLIKNNKNFFVRYLLLANAVLHSRWTLSHEIPRLLKQSFFINHFKKKIFLSHCVGHGLFLRGDLLKEIESMPAFTVTEDLFFGYILSSLGESINPIPVLENSQSPESFYSSLKQKYVWFFGPLDHLSYEKYVRNNFFGKISWLNLKWMTFQGLLPAVAWFLMGWLFLFIFVYPLVVCNYYLFLASLSLFIFYGPLSYTLVFLKGEKIFKLSGFKFIDYFWLIIFCFPVVFIHSLPPIFSLLAKIRQLITKKEPIKPKTER